MKSANVIKLKQIPLMNYLGSLIIIVIFAIDGTINS